MSAPPAPPAEDPPRRRNLHQHTRRRRRSSTRLYPTDDVPHTHPPAPNPFFRHELGAPDSGSYTIGELGAQLHSAHSEDDDSLWFFLSQDGVTYPTLNFSKDGGADGADSMIHSKRPNPDDLLVVNETTNPVEDSSPNKKRRWVIGFLLSFVWSLFVRVLIWLASCGRVLPCCSCLQMCVSVPPPESIVQDIQRLEKGPIFASHDALPLIAISVKKRVFLYDVSRKMYGPGLLVHDVGHDGVVKMAWRGRGRKALAVIGRQGVVFWDVSFEFRDGRICNLKKSASSATSLKVSESTRRVEIQERREGKARIRRDAGGELCRNSRCVVFRVKKGLADCCWAPDGSAFVACSVYDHRLMFWTRRRIGGSAKNWGSKRGWGVSYVTRYNGGIRKVGYSPNGRFLVAVHCQDVFRVWETAFFQNSEKWDVRIGSYVQAFSWTSDSRTLVISAKDDHSITLISFEDSILLEREPRNPDRPEHVKGQILRRIDLHQFVDRGQLDTGIPLCGSIADIQINPRHACRMVVAFDHSELLAVFRCDFDDGHPLSLHPVGFMRGNASSLQRQNDEEVDFEEEEGEVSEEVVAVSSGPAVRVEDHGNLVHQMEFLPWFQKGALLCVLWKDFSMGFIPFYFALRPQ